MRQGPSLLCKKRGRSLDTTDYLSSCATAGLDDRWGKRTLGASHGLPARNKSLMAAKSSHKDVQPSCHNHLLMSPHKAILFFSFFFDKVNLAVYCCSPTYFPLSEGYFSRTCAHFIYYETVCGARVDRAT